MPEHVTQTETAGDRLFTGRLDGYETARLMRCRVLVAGLGNIARCWQSCWLGYVWA